MTKLTKEELQEAWKIASNNQRLDYYTLPLNTDSSYPKETVEAWERDCREVGGSEPEYHIWQDFKVALKNLEQADETDS